MEIRNIDHLKLSFNVKHKCFGRECSLSFTANQIQGNRNLAQSFLCHSSCVAFLRHGQTLTSHNPKNTLTYVLYLTALSRPRGDSGTRECRRFHYAICCGIAWPWASGQQVLAYEATTTNSNQMEKVDSNIISHVQKRNLGCSGDEEFKRAEKKGTFRALLNKGRSRKCQCCKTPQRCECNTTTANNARFRRNSYDGFICN
jgi:hypothetical protein